LIRLLTLGALHPSRVPLAVLSGTVAMLFGALVGASTVEQFPPPLHTTVFFNVNLVPMTHERVIPHQTVLVEEGRITSVGPSTETPIPPGAVVINGQGAYLMPGLADMHVHTREDWVGGAWPVSPLDLYVAHGVTTIRDFGPRGHSPDYALRWRERIQRGEMRGPTIYAAGPILRGPLAHPEVAVGEQHARGFDFVKLYSFLTRDEFERAMSTARGLGMYTAGHIPFAVGLDGVIAAGMKEIAHVEELDFEFLDFDRTTPRERGEWFRHIIERVDEEYPGAAGPEWERFIRELRDDIAAVAAKLRAADIPVCTTLVVGQTVESKLLEPEQFLARAGNRYLRWGYLDAYRRGEDRHQRQFAGNAQVARTKYAFERVLLGELARAGVRLVLGTDSGSGAMGIGPGFSIRAELRILTRNGLSPYQAIATGTVTASQVAAAMTGRDEFGTIEAGKRADLILLDRNPLDAVENIEDPRGVMARGRWYSRSRLQEMMRMVEQADQNAARAASKTALLDRHW
jgi:imidazolonepropionase-like amidohydrolase